MIMSTNGQTVMPNQEEFAELVRRANAGDDNALAMMRQTLDSNPEIWESVGNLATHAQLSMAAQIWPTAYPAYFYGGYNYTAIAREIDFFVVMGYDMIEDARLARRGTAPSDPPGSWDEHANAPLPGLIDGVEQYRQLGVDPSQLVMALPWYRLHATFVASLSLPLCVSLRCITYRLCLSVCFSVSLCVTQHM